MADPFLGEIRILPFGFAPQGWASCNGQLLPISQNTALFSLIGTDYGGNGTSNFALPNLQSRVPMHEGEGPGLSQYVIGETGGTENVTLTSGEMPQHSHAVVATSSFNIETGPKSANQKRNLRNFRGPLQPWANNPSNASWS